MAIRDKASPMPTFEAPTFNAPTYNMPDLDATLGEYGDKGYNWYLDKAGRTPEVKARMEEMLAKRQETFDAANDPERQRERALINRLVAAGGSRTAGNMFGNMVRAGQKTEDIYDANRQKALQNMQDFELANVINPDEAERRAAAESGLGMFGEALGLEKDKSKADFETALKGEELGFQSALKGQELAYNSALGERDAVLDSLLQSEATDADVAAARAKAYQTSVQEENDNFYRYMGEYTDTSNQISDNEFKLQEAVSMLKQEDPAVRAVVKELADATKEAESAWTEGGRKEAANRASAAQAKLELMIKQNPLVKAIRQEINDLRVQMERTRRKLYPTEGGAGTSISDLASQYTVGLAPSN